MSNRAWVTLATNDSYGLGALVLAHSLRRAGSEVPTVVLITPAVTDAMRERLNAVFTEVITVDVLDSRDASHLALLQRPELGITFTKIHCWNLTQYEKCVFLDADTLVVQNCDELFEREELSAAPDVGWPDCFNSGVFVFKPSSETFNRLIAFAQERGSFDGGDQGLLNSFFSDWARSDISKHLPFLYNVTSAAFYSYLPALKHFGQDLKIIHFIGAAKPWLQHFNFETRTVDAPDHIRGLLQLWWDIFVGQVHSQLDTAMVEVEEPPVTPTAQPPHDVSQHFHYQPAIDPESEFPWHWPEAQAAQHPEKSEDIPNTHDRWESYRGNIPPMAEHRDFENQEEVRQYAWDYQLQEHRRHEEQSSHSEPYTHHTHTSEHHSHDPQHSTSSYHDQRSSHEHWHHDSSDHVHLDDHYYEQAQQESHYAPNKDQFSSYNDHSKDYRCDSFSRTESIHHLDERDSYSRTESVHYLDEHISQDTNHKLDNVHKNDPPQNNVQVHHVHVQKNTKNRRPRRHRIDLGTVVAATVLNGEASDSESEYIEDIIPRHPYDGFYLRHRAIIDCRGHKICTHEVPLIPSPTTLTPSESPSLQDYDTAEDIFLSDTEDHSGVAGNLARVVPGGPYDALDDLTRRQGWEAGNIDYMGADSFDNIWAKISQSLTQPRSSPPKGSPPREIPVQVAEVPKEVVSEPVEAAKEAAPVAAPAPAVPAPVADVPKTTSEPTTEPTPVSVPVAEQAASTPVKSQVEAPAPGVTKAKAPVLEAPKVEAPVASIKPAALDEIPVSVVEDQKKTEPKAATPATPVKVLESCPVATDDIPLATDSPPLANTPSKEEAPVVPAAKSEERRRVGKLQLSPPARGDPLPTPDSELEDAASLAHAIIAGELRHVTSPTVTSPRTPAGPAPPPAPLTGLTVEAPQVPTPPVGAVSLAQIGVKPKEKTTTAAQLESSIAAATDKPLDAPDVTPKDAPKKKVVKKVVKKDKDAAASGADAPVPPPRKKEKKPKEV